MVPGRRTKKDSQALWRPDFRDVQELPDTKVIRTGFLLNFLAIMLTLSLGILYAFKEYSLQTVAASLSDLEAQVAGSTTENNRILKASRRFEESRRVIAELVAFDEQLVDYPIFLEQLSEVRPDNIILERIDIGSVEEENEEKGETVLAELNGRLLPTPEGTASEVISRFQESLREITTTEKRTVRTDLTRFSRNNDFGHFDFTLKIRLSPGEEPSR